MELVAKKSFRIPGGARVRPGDRFTISASIGPVYVMTKLAQYPPREVAPPPPPVYQTRMMTAEIAPPIAPVKRGRGRPRKIRPPE